VKQCIYYQAKVKKSACWFFVGVLRSFEHLVFDRTLDKQNSIFEFFVPVPLQKNFEELMGWFAGQGIIFNLQELPNRLSHS